MAGTATQAKDEVWDRAIEIMADKLDKPKEEITAEMLLRVDLELDSLSFVELKMDLEDGFDISMPEEDEAKILTVGDLIESIRKYRGKLVQEPAKE